MNKIYFKFKLMFITSIILVLISTNILARNCLIGAAGTDIKRCANGDEFDSPQGVSVSDTLSLYDTSRFYNIDESIISYGTVEYWTARRDQAFAVRYGPDWSSLHPKTQFSVQSDYDDAAEELQKIAAEQLQRQRQKALRQREQRQQRKKAKYHRYLRKFKKPYENLIVQGAVILADAFMDRSKNQSIKDFIGTVINVFENDKISVRMKVSKQIKTYHKNAVGVAIDCVVEFCVGDPGWHRIKHTDDWRYYSLDGKIRLIFSNRIAEFFYGDSVDSVYFYIEGDNDAVYFYDKHTPRVKLPNETFGIMVQCYQGLCAGDYTTYNYSPKVEVLEVYSSGVILGFDYTSQLFVDWIHSDPTNHPKHPKPSASRSWVRKYLPKLAARIKSIKDGLQRKK